MNQDRTEIVARFRKETAMMALIVLVSMALSFVCGAGFTFLLRPRIADFAFTETFTNLVRIAMLGFSADYAWMTWRLDQSVEDFGRDEQTPLPQSLADLYRRLLDTLTQGGSRRRMELAGQAVLVAVEVVFAHSAYSAVMLVQSLVLLAIQQPLLRRFRSRLEQELPAVAE